MSTLLFVTLFVVSVLAFWLMLPLGRRAKRRFKSRTAPLQKPSADDLQDKLPGDLSRSPVPQIAQRSDPVSPEGTARPDSDSSEVEKVSTEATHIHSTETNLPPREATPEYPHMSVVPVLTPSKANSQAAEAIVGEQTEASSEAEELQVKLVPPKGTIISDKELESGPSKGSRSEAPPADATIPISLVEADGPAIEPALTSAIAGEKPTQADTPISETLEAVLTEKEPILKPPTYQPLTPPGQAQRTSGARERTSRSTPRADTDLRLRLQLVFDRSGFVKTLALVADRREGMPENVEAIGTQGELRLTELRDDCYEAVPLVDAGNALLRGIVWRGCGDARRWRWVLGGRELYVLASGDVCGLYPFGSSARLMLNARHVVLATVRLREEVLTALEETGVRGAGI